MTQHHDPLRRGPVSLALVLAALLLGACGAGQRTGAPTSPGELHVGYTSEADFEDLPSLLAQERLREQGYLIETTFFAQTELAVEALSQGEVDITHGSIVTHWTAAAQGAEIVTLMEHTGNAWLLIARPDITSCQDLDGRRVAHHSEGAGSKALTDAYLAEHCPSVEPYILIMPGSSNRAAALIQGEIDATPIRIPDLVEIEQQAPDGFATLATFSEALPGVKIGGVHVNRSFLRDHTDAAEDYVKALLTVYRELAQNPEPLVALAGEWLAIPPDRSREVAQRYLAIHAWKSDGGLSQDSAQATLDFLLESGQLPQGTEVQELIDLRPLEAARRELNNE